MNTPPILLLIAAALVSAAVIVAGLIIRRRGSAAGIPRWGLALCVAPSLVQLALFYSLAVHMHHRLGAWPRSIGERGFPPGLLVHASLAVHWFNGLFVATLFVWPVAFAVCLLVRVWRRWAVCLGAYALAFAASVGLMVLAPAPFLYWWWD